MTDTTMMPRARATRRGWGRRLTALVASLALGGCNLSDLVEAELPPNTINPGALQTEEGALALYRGTLAFFRRAHGGANGSYVINSGRLTDELTTGVYVTTFVPTLTPGTLTEVDARDVPEDQTLRSKTLEKVYRDLNLGRNQAVDALYYLRNYAPYQPKDLQGHLYAIRGYSLILLADLYCSGIPLTEYRSPGGFAYKPGSPTEVVYEQAVAQFDSALASIPDSARYRNLAKIGKARALLNLGRQAEAAAAVADVPTSYRYENLYAMDYDGSFANNWTWGVRNTFFSGEDELGLIGDREGGNGLPFVSAKDPRVPLVVAPLQNTSYPNSRYLLPAWMFPNDAVWKGTSPEPKNGEDILLASGIEARLIEAEAAAAAGNSSFLTILNALRTTCTAASSCATPAPAGSGNVAGLAPLEDPGTRDARIKLVMDERAYWLFLTGQRQGDLRRLVRVYGRPQETVYPTGAFPAGVKQAYGTFTNLPVPHTEKAINPQYKGCIDRDA